MKEGRISSAFAQMSDRERKLVVGGGTLVVVGMVVIAGLLVSRKVAAMEEQVAQNGEALRSILDAAPSYLKNRREDKAIGEQLTRAEGSSLQSTLLAIAKDVKFERKYGNDGTSEARLSDYIKFSNASEILADLTQKKKRRGRSKRKRKRKKKGKSSDKQVFLATIEVVFDRIPDGALFQFLEKVETNKEAMFGVSLNISRESPNHDHFRAKLKVGQFRYGGGDQ
ncbi:MAG: hypothetical protein KC502_01660 [Myxococcales bacterium]|nr:hypothetical protein [Myxococcales bacterium]